MSLIIPANSASAAGGYEVANSCRFNGSNDNLSKTFGSGNRKTFTISAWVKRCKVGDVHTIFSRYTANNDAGFLGLYINPIYLNFTGWSTEYFVTNRVFRDTSAWYHIVLAVDTTQSTSTDRWKLYVNGVQETSFSTTTYPALNADLAINENVAHYVGQYNTANYFNGYMSEVCFIDGLALAADSFGEFGEDSGIWKPIDVSGLTFGNNGFYLDYEDSGNLGNDANGGTDLTENNLTAIDQSTDTCSTNYATLNPLTKSSATFSEGNLKQGGAGASAVATFGVSSGKWYFEQKILGGNNEAHLGFALEGSGIFSDNVTGSTVRGAGYVSLYSYDGKIYNEGSATASFGTFAANNIIGFALDVDNGNVYLYQNGSVLNSGNAVVSGKTGKTWFPFANFDAGDVTGIEHNFGGTQSFAISSGNQDPNGYGNFEYSTNGYYALNTKNLAEYG